MSHTLFVLLLLLSFNRTNAQKVWDDSNAMDSLKRGLHCIYNFEFDQALNIELSINKKYPAEPALYMYKSLYLYWKHYPVLAGTEIGDQYENLLMEAISESKEQLILYPENHMVILFDMLPRMMLLQFYADNGQGFKSIPYLSRLYESLVKGFTYCKSTPEFYFPTGLYNYYIEAYPEANPFYKPFVIFFPSGNKDLGLSQLYQCWKLSDLIGIEAMTFLTYIQINFETNYQAGVRFARELSEGYPNNPLFALYYEQLLLLSKQYSKAEELSAQFREQHNNSAFFSNIFDVYDGIIAEKYFCNYNLAQEKYKSAIPALEPFQSFGNRYRAYANFGLSRIAKRKGETDDAKDYRTAALKLAQYPQVNFDQ